MSQYAPSLPLGLRRPYGVVLALLLGGCTSNLLPEHSIYADVGGGTKIDLPVTSLVGRRFETVVRQQYDFSCGSAALAALLRYHYGDPQTEQSVFIGMFRDGDQSQIRRLGFSLLDMKRYLAGRGISADGYKVSLEQVGRAKLPGIALINFNGYKHFVVLKGLSRRTVLIGDPSLGLRREGRSTFLKQWNGVLFVLNGRESVGMRHFNQSVDLVRAPGDAPFWQAGPLSISGLELTRPMILPAPLPREF